MNEIFENPAFNMASNSYISNLMLFKLIFKVIKVINFPFYSSKSYYGVFKRCDSTTIRGQEYKPENQRS